jgi:hypothetical protein
MQDLFQELLQNVRKSSHLFNKMIVTLVDQHFPKRSPSTLQEEVMSDNLYNFDDSSYSFAPKRKKHEGSSMKAFDPFI